MRQYIRKPDKNWQPLVPALVPEEAAKAGVVFSMHNDQYTVHVKETASPGFQIEGPGGKGIPMPMRHLMILRSNGDKRDLPWRDKQRIKNEVCGTDSEAVELFPAKWRDLPMTQCHLWVMPPGVNFPVGVVPERRSTGTDPSLDALRELGVTREDIEVTVVEGDIIEVFASQEEAIEMYAKNGAGEPVCVKKILGDVPAEGDGVAWSDGAKEKLQNVISKAVALNASKQPEPEPGVEYDDGPASMEDELVGDCDSGPTSVEEGLLLASKMEEKIAEVSASREMSAADASRIVEGEVGRRESDAVSESAAAVDLAKYREELLRKKGG